MDADGLTNFTEYLLGTDPESTTALAAGLDPNEENPRFFLNYSVRKDRDDGSLGAFQSSTLEAWTPAVNDELISEDGPTQQRRAWLPLADGGYLRLEVEE